MRHYGNYFLFNYFILLLDFKLHQTFRCSRVCTVVLEIAACVNHRSLLLTLGLSKLESAKE